MGLTVKVEKQFSSDVFNMTFDMLKWNFVDFTIHDVYGYWLQLQGWF